MHVPVLILLDNHFAQNDPQYQTNKSKKRQTIITVSFFISLFWGSLPLLGLTPLTFEPSYMSCSVYQENPNTAYIVYIMCCFFFFELGPLGIVVYCKTNTKPESKQSIKVSFFCYSKYLSVLLSAKEKV